MVHLHGRFAVRTIRRGDHLYPPQLAAIHDPPPELFVRGAEFDLLDAPIVAIVGSRKASDHGRRIAAEIAGHLAAMGVVVASGLAYGIDAAAHRGTLHAGGKTIAVLGCGIDIDYPVPHAELAQQIAASGLVITEFPSGTLPMPYNFPQRNRIISGLSLAVVVVEAAEQSGSLITARFALEQGREVFAVPGRAGEQNARGTNRLIRDGAALVERGEEVADLIADRLPVAHKMEMAGLLGIDGDKDSPLLSAMRGQDAVCVDWLVRKTNLGASQVLETLTRLVVAGFAVELPGRRFRLKGS